MQAVSVVLAAGEGRRMGGNKALVRLRGRPLLKHVLTAVAGSGAGGVIVVIGAEADRVRPLAEEAGARAVENPAWRRGQTSSLQAGLRALPADCGAFLLHPVDHALVTASDLDALLTVWKASPDPDRAICRPRCGDAFGHPVLFGRAWIPNFLSLASDEPAHTIYRAHRDTVTLVPVTNPDVAADLDTPEDLARYERLA